MNFALQNMFADMAPGSATFAAPSVFNSRVPTINTTTPMGQAAARAMGSMGAGWTNGGAKAFLPGDLNYYDFSYDSPYSNYGMGEEGGPNMQLLAEKDAFRNHTNNQILGLAKNLGYNLGGYSTDTSSSPSVQSVMDWQRGGNSRLDQQRFITGSSVPRQEAKSIQSLYDAMNTDLKDFSRIRGASTGWDGRGDPRSTAEALYYQTSPGVYQAMSNPNFGRKQEHKGWAREEGAETIAGLSMIMPAFGGWAGMLGQGTAGTLSAGSGLGLTSSLGSVVGNGLANSLVNMAGNSLMTGQFNPTGALAGLGMQGLSGLYNTGTAFPDNSAALSGANSYNNLGQLMNSGVGQAIRGTVPWRAIGGNNANMAMRGISTLGRLFS